MNLHRVSAPRLADVASLAGVSLATASRVLNGSTRTVAESYRDRVVQAAAELGYTANISAQATARGTSAIIALLVADIVDPYFANIAAGVARYADEAGLVVTIATTSRDPERETALLQTLRGQRPRAVILAASRSGSQIDPAAAQLAAAGSKVVALGHPEADESPATDRAVRWLGVDNRGGARDLGAAVSNLGYRRAVIIAAEEGVRTSDDRVCGFIEGFEASGAKVVHIRRCAFNREGGKTGMAQIIADGLVGLPGDGQPSPERSSEPTLIFAITDAMAIGALRELRNAGLEIGRDVALCGFDDIAMAIDVTPELTTVNIPLAELGYMAAREAIESAGQSVELPLGVVLRESTPEVGEVGGS